MELNQYLTEVKEYSQTLLLWERIKSHKELEEDVSKRESYKEIERLYHVCEESLIDKAFLVEVSDIKGKELLNTYETFLAQASPAAVELLKTAKELLESTVNIAEPAYLETAFPNLLRELILIKDYDLLRKIIANPIKESSAQEPSEMIFTILFQDYPEELLNVLGKRNDSVYDEVESEKLEQKAFEKLSHYKDRSFHNKFQLTNCINTFLFGREAPFDNETSYHHYQNTETGLFEFLIENNFFDPNKGRYGFIPTTDKELVITNASSCQRALYSEKYELAKYLYQALNNKNKEKTDQYFSYLLCTGEKENLPLSLEQPKKNVSSHSPKK